jgi:ribosomal protein L40E
LTETDATKITKFCSECGSEINVKAEICPKCGVRQVISKEKRKLGIKEKLPLINNDNKRIRMAGYIVYAFVFLIIFGTLLSSGPVPMETYTIFGQFQVDAPKGLELMDDIYSFPGSSTSATIAIQFMSQERYEGAMEQAKDENWIEQEPITSSGGQQFIVYKCPGQNKENDIRDVCYYGFNKIGDKYMDIAVFGDFYNEFATITKSFRKI